MPFWQLLLLAAVPSVAAVLSAYLGFRDLGLRRRLETSKQFVSLFAAAHGRPTDGRDGAIGVGEQVATIHLIADFAAKEGVLVNAAIAGLRNIETWDTHLPADPPNIDLSSLQGQEPDDRIQELETALKKILSSSSPQSLEQIAGAARAALARLEPRMRPGHVVHSPRSS